METELQRIQRLSIFAGIMTGIISGMLFCAGGPPLLRIELEKSVPLAAGGGFIGVFLGLALSEVYKRASTTRPLITILSAAFLAGGIGAVIGWIVGDGVGTKAIQSPFVEMSQELVLARQGMGLGAMMGVVLGTSLGTIHWLWRRNQLLSS